MNNVKQWLIPRDHPAFAGHFPASPILPGVVLLDLALQFIAEELPIPSQQCIVNSVKFLSPALPGELLNIHYSSSATGTVNFEISVDARRIAIGSILYQPLS